MLVLLIEITEVLKVMIHNLSNNDYVIKKNDRIAQLILEKIKTPPVELVEELDDTVRGEGGFGSTENKLINKIILVF